MEIINFLTKERLQPVIPWQRGLSAPVLEGTVGYMADQYKENLYQLTGNVDEQVVAERLPTFEPPDPSPGSSNPSVDMLDAPIPQHPLPVFDSSAPSPGPIDPVDTPEASVLQHPWCGKLMVAALVIGALALTYSVVRVGRQKVFAAT